MVRPSIIKPKVTEWFCLFFFNEKRDKGNLHRVKIWTDSDKNYGHERDACKKSNMAAIMSSNRNIQIIFYQFFCQMSESEIYYFIHNFWIFRDIEQVYTILWWVTMFLKLSNNRVNVNFEIYVTLYLGYDFIILINTHVMKKYLNKMIKALIYKLNLDIFVTVYLGYSW